jgi:hypothetical protein
MKHMILEAKYEEKFIDTKIYSPNTVFFLRGLAAAIQDAHPSWRPNVSELAKILKSCDKKYRNGLLNAGASYGAAKQIGPMYPGPAILLLGAALQAIGEGSYPNAELDKHIALAEGKLESTELNNDKDIKAVLSAAKERAGFDRVSELMRMEFRKGLESAGCSRERIDIIVGKIVDITHEVRHRAVIDRSFVHVIELNTMNMVRTPSGSLAGCGIYCANESAKSLKEISGAERSDVVRDSREGISDPFAEVGLGILEGGILMITSDFGDLLSYAQKGCANRILSCINKIRR